MKVECRAVIQRISEVTETPEGAKWISVLIETQEEYPLLLEVGMYKKKEYAEHVESFVKYNKVGDTLDFELSVRSNEYNGRMYPNFNIWRSTRVENTPSNNPPLPSAAPPPISDEVDDLPFSRGV